MADNSPPRYDDSSAYSNAPPAYNNAPSNAPPAYNDDLPAYNAGPSPPSYNAPNFSKRALPERELQPHELSDRELLILTIDTLGNFHQAALNKQFGLLKSYITKQPSADLLVSLVLGRKKLQNILQKFEKIWKN